MIRADIERIIADSIKYVNDNIFSLGHEKVNINFEVLNNLDFQGKSRLLDNNYDILIYSGIFAKLELIFDSLLLEENNKNNKGFYYIVSNDQEYDKIKAKAYRDLLIIFSSKLVIYHEIGHIVDGHLAYIKSLNINYTKEIYLNTIDESLKKELNIISIEKQLLELDADCFAASYLIGNLTHDSNINRLNSVSNGLIQDRTHSLLLLIISSIITFTIMGAGKEREVKDFNELSYLPLRTRHHYYLRTLFTAYEGINKEKPLINILETEEIIPHIEKYVYIFNKNFDINNDNYENINNNLHELDDIHKEYCDSLDLYWRKTLRPKLLKFTHTELALI